MAAAAAAVMLAAGAAWAGDAEDTRRALDEVHRIRGEATASGGYIVGHQVAGQTVYTIVSRQSLENQITLAIVNGEMDVEDASGLVRAMRALTDNALDDLNTRERDLTRQSIADMAAQQDSDAYWASRAPYRDRYGSVPVAPSRRADVRPGYGSSGSPSYRRDRAGGRRGSGGSSGYGSSGRSSFAAAVDDAGRSARPGRRDRRDKADRRMSGDSYPSAPPADDRRRKKRRDRVS